MATATGMLIQSQPNRNAISHRKGFIKDEKLDSAIKITDGNNKIRKQGCGLDFSNDETEDCAIYNCYSSGNDEMDDFETTLAQIADEIRTHKKRLLPETLIRNPLNGDEFDRGYVETNWIANYKLVIVNHRKSTFIEVSLHIYHMPHYRYRKPQALCNKIGSNERRILN